MRLNHGRAQRAQALPKMAVFRGSRLAVGFQRKMTELARLLLSAGMNGRMFCADCLVDVSVHHVVKPMRRIPAQNIYVLCLGELVAELLHLNRSLCVPFCH